MLHNMSQLSHDTNQDPLIALLYRKLGIYLR